jgi:hypothetical protein
MIPALAIVATVIAALIAAGAAYYGTQVGSRTTLEGVRRTLAANRDTERRREARALQDAAYSRIRSAYAAIIAATVDIRFIMDMTASLHAQRNDEAFGGTVPRFMTSLDTLRKAQAELLLEANTDEALSGLDEIRQRLFHYLSLLQVPRDGHTFDSLKQLADLRADVDVQLLALAELGRAQLAALARPVNESDDNAPQVE